MVTRGSEFNRRTEVYEYNPKILKMLALRFILLLHIREKVLILIGVVWCDVMWRDAAWCDVTWCQWNMSEMDEETRLIQTNKTANDSLWKHLNRQGAALYGDIARTYVPGGGEGAVTPTHVVILSSSKFIASTNKSTSWTVTPFNVASNSL